ncbi:hypothetical protein [Fibrobacter sp. UBA4297]|uniref:hypothetical protein n=1 Tax=Fibrobacter sp. UBA4297 TaxID=1946536 RepID=UPI0025C097D9|nr:hypothetical protein [Fibrobacter sp. UBA4297]
MSFQIDCIEIAAKTKKRLLKEIKPGRFFFNDFYQKSTRGEILTEAEDYYDEKDLYAPNINVTAIVGRNGSGKSTLIDLVLLVVNNFCYMFERGHERNGAESLLYIPGLYATLFFRVNGECRKIVCRDESISLFYEGGSYSFEICKNESLRSIVSNNDIIKITEKIFYTIVSNYSLQSFIFSNYLSDFYKFDYLNNKDVLVKMEDCDGDNAWVNGLFHKNDGYVRSVVLNPYRENGRIDISKELKLSKDRTSALFVFANEQKKDFFEPYIFHDLKFSLKKGFFLQKFKKILKDKRVPEDVIGCYNTDDDVLSVLNDDFICVIKDFFFLDIKKLNKLDKFAFLYIQLKIFIIINKYVGFESYRDSFVLVYNESSREKVLFNIVNDEKFVSLIKLIRQDDSHVTKKIRRTINFLRSEASAGIEKSESHFFSGRKYFKSLHKAYLKSVQRVYPKELVFDKFFLDSLTYEKELDYLLLTTPFDGITGKFISPVDIEKALLPSFFSYDLLLYKNTDVVKYEELSSGELQLIQTLSVHMYHIENILSIKNESGINRPVYRNINLIFDEIELCFHIEYQCTFVKKLIDMILSMRQNKECSINIILITHSPFILTDIPSRKSLYLCDGVQHENKNETFAQNTFSLLHNNFLVSSLFGDFARKKIFDLLNCLTGKEHEYDWNEDSIDAFVTLVGDELLRNEIIKLRKRFSCV